MLRFLLPVNLTTARPDNTGDAKISKAISTKLKTLKVPLAKSDTAMIGKRITPAPISDIASDDSQNRNDAVTPHAAPPNTTAAHTAGSRSAPGSLSGSSAIGIKSNATTATPKPIPPDINDSTKRLPPRSILLFLLFSIYNTFPSVNIYGLQTSFIRKNRIDKPQRVFIEQIKAHRRDIERFKLAVQLSRLGELALRLRRKLFG